MHFDPQVEGSLLQRPWDLTMDEDGYFYVVDGSQHRVAVFDPQGRFVRSIGQQGQGPGDLFSPTEISYADGILTIPGSPRLRTTRFHRDGRLLDVITIPRGSGSPAARPYLSSEGLLAVEESFTERDDTSLRSGERVVTYTATGDTLAFLQSGPNVRAIMRNAEQYVRVQSTGQLEIRTLPTASSLHFIGGAQATYVASRNQILTADGTRPEIRWYALNGTLQELIRLVIPVEKVTSDERVEILARLDSLIAEAEVEEDPGRRETRLLRARQAKEIVILPEEKAYWSWVDLDDEGYYWLRLPTPYFGTTERNESYRFKVLSPQGEYLGDTEIPARRRHWKVVQGHLLTLVLIVQTGELVPTVYRMVPIAPGLRYP